MKRHASHPLCKALRDAGIPFDRKRFLPHITLIRKAAGKMGEIPIEMALHMWLCP